MLRRVLGVAALASSARRGPVRSFSAAAGNGDDGKKPKNPSAKDVLGGDVLNAVDAVADKLHSKDVEAKKRTKNALLSKLMDVEKTTFQNATEVQTEELVSDTTVLNILKDVSTDISAKKPKRAADQRQARRGLLLLRKEIFYQAKQDGYTSEEASKIAENAVTEAEERLSAQRRMGTADVERKEAESEKAMAERTEKERQLYDYAFQTAEKMLYKDETDGTSILSQKSLNPDPRIPPILKTNARLGIFKKDQDYRDNTLGFWAENDMRAARICAQSMGPGNAFEEQIEWTKAGKQWPYPIDNEFLQGEEEKVPFYEHIFLERHLSRLGLPKEGPVAHFMELVCVGLSKNPYMTAQKKREHLEWFATYFNAEKQKYVEKLHEQELQAAANA